MHSTPPPRSRISRALRQKLFARSGATCEHGCGRSIELETFHVAHLRAHASGGPEVEANLEAWCTQCNYDQGSRDASDSRLPPRQWQLEALDQIVARIAADGAATVSAAPGAGKTIFAGLVFEALYDAGIVDRLVVLTPRATLVEQWAASLHENRHIQLKGNSAIERRGQHGVVLTYAAMLNQDTVEALRVKASQSRTLLVLDEVHHVGESEDGNLPAWSRSVADFAGTVDKDLRVAGVLNLSGTLWRSKPSERISTVRYASLPDGGLVSLVDYEVSAESLILAGQLRALDLFRLGAQVRISDIERLEVVDSEIADLDERPARLTLEALAKSPDWRETFVQSVLERLEIAHRSLDRYHVKALIVAARQDQAHELQAEVNRQMRMRGLTPLADVATSSDPMAPAVLERFKKTKRVGVLCTVDMAGEGYDCPDIVVVGYVTNKLTTLYVRQVVARAMRVTQRERDLGQILPAAIVVPDVKMLVDKLAAYLAPYLHEVFQPDAISSPAFDQERMDGQQPLLPRYQVEEIRSGDETVTVPNIDGSRDNFSGEVVARFAKQLEKVQIPPALAARFLVAMKRTVGDLRDERPFEGLPADAAVLQSFITDGADDSPPAKLDAAPASKPAEAFASIETRAKLIQAALKRLEGWWSYNGDSPVGVFAAAANRVAGISGGGRPRADLSQLERALEHERTTIASFCARTGKAQPKGLGRSRQ